METARARTLRKHAVVYVASCLLAAGTACAGAGCDAVLAQDRHASPSSETLQTAPTAVELGSIAHALGSESASRRELAYRTLTTLDEDALDAIAQRISALSHEQLDRVTASQVLTKFRHGTGSRRADDVVDIAPGVLPLLNERRDATVVRIAEPLLLMRSLERIGTAAAVRLIAEIASMDSGAWLPECKLAANRLGPRAISAIIETGQHPNAYARAWSRWGTKSLAAGAPGMLVQDKPTTILADILRAWGKVLDFDAMRVVVSYVGSEHAEVRDAARFAMERYGRNGVWQLRQAYENVTGKEPNPAWSWRTLMQALFRAHDEASLAGVRQYVVDGNAALARRDFAGMRAKFDEALARAPRLDGREQLAAGYAQYAEDRLAHHDLRAARQGFARALALAPSHAEGRRWNAKLARVEADLQLARGVVDLPQYARVLAFDAADESTRDSIDRLSGARTQRLSKWKRVAAFASALLLVALGIWLLRRSRVSASNAGTHEAPGDESSESTTLADQSIA